jgi:hypothetical protein
VRGLGNFEVLNANTPPRGGIPANLYLSLYTAPEAYPRPATMGDSDRGTRRCFFITLTMIHIVVATVTVMVHLDIHFSGSVCCGNECSIQPAEPPRPVPNMTTPEQKLVTAGAPPRQDNHIVS